MKVEDPLTQAAKQHTNKLVMVDRQDQDNEVGESEIVLDHYHTGTVDDEDATLQRARLQNEQENVNCHYVADSFRPTTDEFLAAAHGDKIQGYQ